MVPVMYAPPPPPETLEEIETRVRTDSSHTYATICCETAGGFLVTENRHHKTPVPPKVFLDLLTLVEDLDEDPTDCTWWVRPALAE